MLADLDAANAEANRLAKQLEATSLEAQELAATADELLSLADAELEGFPSRARPTAGGGRGRARGARSASHLGRTPRGCARERGSGARRA